MVDGGVKTIKPDRNASERALVNQAIQPEVVGPLFIKGCIVYIVAKLIGIGCGTSIDIINVRGPWRVSAMARKVG